jgi:hypothetical protein
MSGVHVGIHIPFVRSGNCGVNVYMSDAVHVTAHASCNMMVPLELEVVVLLSLVADLEFWLEVGTVVIASFPVMVRTQ